MCEPPSTPEELRRVSTTSRDVNFPLLAPISGEGHERAPEAWALASIASSRSSAVVTARILHHNHQGRLALDPPASPPGVLSSPPAQDQLADLLVDGRSAQATAAKAPFS